MNRHDPNDPVIGYQRTSLSTDLHNAVEWVMTWDVTPTDLEAGAASSDGDFRYVDGTYTTFCGKNWWTPSSGGVIGFARCTDLVGQACDVHWIYAQETWVAQATTFNIRKFMCHETGHAIGITHNEHTSSAYDSCMKDPSSSSSIANYSNHEVQDLINPHW